MVDTPTTTHKTGQMAVRRVVPVMTVADIDTARLHYREVLGMEVVMDHGWIVTLATPGNIQVQLSLMTTDATATSNPDLSIEVDDVDGAYQAAADAGLEIVHPLTDEEWGVRRFFFRDGSGNVVNVLSHA